jgi:hypothetical protein
MAGANPCSQSELQATCQIKTTPTHEGSRRFELTLLVTQQIFYAYGGPVKTSSFAAVLSRHQGQMTESDSYSFLAGSGHPLTFSWGERSAKPLQFAQIKGTFGNGRGSIDLTFHPTGPARYVGVPKGCGGHGGRRRPGTFIGSFTLYADKLGAITHKSLKATISTASYTCNLPTPGYGVQTDASHELPLLIVRKPSSTGPVSETIDVFRNWNGGFYTHTYTVSGLPSSDFTLDTSTLSTGQVKGAGGISGTATYNSTHSSTQLTVGRMGGSLAVTFASIGKVTPFPSSRAAEEWAPKANG